jgi:hypothetical protein
MHRKAEVAGNLTDVRSEFNPNGFIKGTVNVWSEPVRLWSPRANLQQLRFMMGI